MIHILEHVLMHTVEDTLKLVPFLFLTYLGMEYLENRAGDKTIAILSKTGNVRFFPESTAPTMPQQITTAPIT